MADGVLYFSNFSDQRLYRTGSAGDDPVPLTPASALRYADGVIDRNRQYWVGVREDHRDPQREALNMVVRARRSSFRRGRRAGLSRRPRLLFSPRLSPDGRWLAYIAWDHPNMPWVELRSTH